MYLTLWEANKPYVSVQSYSVLSYSGQIDLIVLVPDWPVSLTTNAACGMGMIKAGKVIYTLSILLKVLQMMDGKKSISLSPSGYNYSIWKIVSWKIE